MPRRSEPYPHPDWQPRDELVFADIYERRGLTALQITARHYPLDQAPEKRTFPITARHSSCEKRLLQCVQHGYLERHEQLVKRSQGSKDYIYLLSPKGVRLLAEWLGLPRSELPYYTYDPERKSFEHLLERNNFWICLKLACDKNSITVVEWLTENHFKRDPLKIPAAYFARTGNQKSESVKLEPDDYIHLFDGKDRLHRFVEIDLGGETTISLRDRYKSWKQKIERYLAYHKSGEYTKRFDSRGMVVLTVTTSQERLANLIRATEAAGGEQRFWFTTFEKVTSETVLTEKIWETAKTHEMRSLLLR